MEQLDIVLDHKQAKVFARAIYRDVSAYIWRHRKEYEQFLLEQKGTDAHEENQSSH